MSQWSPRMTPFHGSYILWCFTICKCAFVHAMFTITWKYVGLAENLLGGTAFLQGTNALLPKCPFFRGSTVHSINVEVERFANIRQIQFRQHDIFHNTHTHNSYTREGAYFSKTEHKHLTSCAAHGLQQCYHVPWICILKLLTESLRLLRSSLRDDMLSFVWALNCSDCLM